VVPGLDDLPRGCLGAPGRTFATAPSCTVAPALRPCAGGCVRCHYPLGDPDRAAAIAHDGGVVTTATT
jgi:dipeptide transport system ATP-binding protein